MTPRREGISPKDFAAAIGVSESSIKRWVDQGLLRAVRTAGGHRRIAPDEAKRWIREHRVHPVRPELLGIGALDTPGVGSPASHLEAFQGHLTAGRTLEARGVVMRLFLGGHTVAAIADELVAPALSRVGHATTPSDGALDAALIARRATDIAVHIAKDLDGLVTEQRARPRGLVAVGGALVGDPHVLPPMLAAVTLAEVGFAPTNLGVETPLELLEHAVQRLGARLVWVNVSVAPSSGLAAEVAAFATRMLAADVAVAVGGQKVDALGLGTRAGLGVGRAMADLATFGASIAPAPVRPAAIAAR